jgi:hypothetical protein
MRKKFHHLNFHSRDESLLKLDTNGSTFVCNWAVKQIFDLFVTDAHLERVIGSCDRFQIVELLGLLHLLSRVVRHANQ